MPTCRSISSGLAALAWTMSMVPISGERYAEWVDLSLAARAAFRAAGGKAAPPMEPA